MKTKILFIFTLISTSVCLAQTARIINSETGEASQAVEFTNGTCFIIGHTSYRIDIQETADDLLRNKLKAIRYAFRFHNTDAGDIFGVFAQTTDIPIVCYPNVSLDKKINLNTQDDSLSEVIDLICFRIGAEAIIRNGAVIIIPRKTQSATTQECFEFHKEKRLILNKGKVSKFTFPETGGALFEHSDFISYIELVDGDDPAKQICKRLTYCKIHNREESYDDLHVLLEVKMKRERDDGSTYEEMQTMDNGLHPVLRPFMNAYVEWTKDNTILYSPDLVTLSKAREIDFVNKLNSIKTAIVTPPVESGKVSLHSPSSRTLAEELK